MEGICLPHRRTVTLRTKYLQDIRTDALGWVPYKLAVRNYEMSDYSQLSNGQYLNYESFFFSS